jgi:hypothetical protein
MPSPFVYRKPRPFKFTGDPLQDAPAQEQAKWGEWTDRLVDVEVVFTELDDGVHVEWRVQLKPNCYTAAKHAQLVAFGHMDRLVLASADAHAVAKNFATRSIVEAFPWREERVYH